MDELIKVPEKKDSKEEFLFQNLFSPFTPFKAIQWLIIIGFIIYLNALFNGFVWDDEFQLEFNSYVQTGHYFYYFAHTIGPYYKPLMFFIYTLFFQFFQLNTFFYHFFQVSLHSINAIFVFLLFKYFFKKNTVSFLLAVLFLIHPVNEETVAYIADYQDILFTFFGLAALLVSYKQLFKKYTDIVTAILLLLSVLSKETGILFIGLAILFSLIFKKEKKIKTIVFSFSAGILYLLTRYLLVGGFNPTHFNNVVPANTITSAPLIERLYTIPKIIVFYFSSFVYPNNLAVQYWYVKSINFPDFFLPLIIDLFIFLFLIAYGLYLNKQKIPLAKTFWFFFLWFGAGLLFHLQIVPLDFTAADRWFYFPMIGLLGMIAVFVCTTKIKNTLFRKALLSFVVLIFIIFSVRTIIRNTNWYSTVVLFQHDIPTMENIADAQYLFGTGLLQQGDYSDASIHLKRASQLAPNDYQVWHNLGIVYLNLNQFDQAKMCFAKEIALHKSSSPYISLVYILLVQHQSKEALNEAETYVKEWPNDPFLWRMLGLAAYQLHNKTLALNAFEKSLSIAPYSITQYYISQLQEGLPIQMMEL